VRALDTNLLVRILTRDDERQARAVDRLLVRTGDEAFFVPATVMLEVEWVLRSAFRKSKAARIQAFNALLGNGALQIEHHQAFEIALDMFENVARADFADCIHVAMSRAQPDGPREPLVTFDRICARLPGTQRLNV
jgi:predicted nucleic-acid-binding protein